MKMEVTLSPEEIKQIIKDYLDQKFSSVGDVKLSVSEVWQGHGYNEYKTTIFTGAVCEVEI